MDLVSRGPAGADNAPYQSVKAKIEQAIREAGPDKEPRDIFFNHVFPAIGADYDHLVEELKKLCYTELKQRRISAWVSGRAKALESIRKSVDRREKYRLDHGQPPYKYAGDILVDVHDLAGVRIVLNSGDDTDKADAFIQSCFRQMKKPTVFLDNRDVGKAWKPRFGSYSTKNHQVCLNSPGPEALAPYHDILFEIQVTDVSAHLYNALAHPLLYKDSSVRLSRADEIVIDMTHGITRTYALCLRYMKERVNATISDDGLEDTMQCETRNAMSLGNTHWMETDTDTDTSVHIISEVSGDGFAENLATQASRAIGLEDFSKVFDTPPENCRSVGELQRWFVKKLDEIYAVGQAPINLSRVPGASYDSLENQDLSRCQPGTRASILRKIKKWAQNHESETILWVYGPAGIGKSTVSLTVARSFDDRGLLGASYFFKRGQDDRNDASRFIPTIASQLMISVPGFRECLRESLKKPRNVDIEKKAMEVQFDALVLGPLSQIPTTKSPHRLTRVIVIDALDECLDECEPQLQTVFRLFSKLGSLDKLQMRVLVTSRDTHSIVRALKRLDGFGRHVYEKLALHEEFPEETKGDIAAFLQMQFAVIKEDYGIMGDWPDPSDLGRIVNLATSPSPLFIYASTLCRFIDDGKGREQPTERLEVWLDQCDGNTPQLDQVYRPILNYVVFGSFKVGDKPNPLPKRNQLELLQILRAIVVLATPLPGRAIAALLGLKENSVNHHLRNLHAVLNVPSDSKAPVRLLHQSFRDFLLGNEGTEIAILPLDETQAHILLVRQCISLMEKTPLRRDICDINDPGRLRDTIEDEFVAKHIPLELEYACRFWVHHQVPHERFVLGGEEVRKFFTVHFLYWVECLSLLRRVPDGLMSIKRLWSAYQLESVVSPPLRTFLLDADTFLFTNGPIIERAPLQIYSSALAFTPAERELKKLLWEVRFPFIKSINGVKTASSQTLRGHNDWVNAVAFSPDGKTVASASRDHSIRLWDTALGTYQRTLEGHTGRVNSISFFPDSKTITSVSGGDSIRLWHADTGVCQHTLAAPRNSSQWDTAAFSPDGKVIAYFPRVMGEEWRERDARICLWDTTSARVLWETKYPGNACARITISPDGFLVALVSSDQPVLLWNSGDGTIWRTLHHTTTMTSVSFSPDSKTIATGLQNGRIRLWDVCDSSHRDIAAGHVHEIGAIAFSPDGRTIAGSADAFVQLWNVQDGTLLYTFEGHIAEVMALAFSPNSMTIASGSFDRTVRLWRLTSIEGSFSSRDSGLEGNINIVVISPDLKVIALGSKDVHTVQLWDSRTGALQYTLTDDHALMGARHTVSAIAFSPNSRFVASYSWDTIRLWDAMTGAHKHTLECRAGPENDIVFSPDGRMVAAASSSGFWLWDATTGTSERTLGVFKHPRNDIIFSPDGKTVLQRGIRGLDMWDTTMNTPKLTLRFKRDLLPDSVAFSPDSKSLAVATLDRVLLFDTPEGTHSYTLTNKSAVFPVATFSPDSKTLAATSNNMIQLWDMRKATHLHTLKGHIYWINLISFSPDGGILASASYDQTVQLWHVSTGAIHHTIKVPGHFIDSFAFSPCHNTLSSASSGKFLFRTLALASHTRHTNTIRLWDAAGDFFQRTLEVHKGPVRILDFSHEGTTITSRSAGYVQVWDAATGHCIPMLEESKSPEIAVSSDFQTLAKVSQRHDGVQCWDFAKGTRGHYFSCSCDKANMLSKIYTVESFSFSPEGKTLAISCQSAVHLWDIMAGKDRKLRRPETLRHNRQIKPALDVPREQELAGDTLAVGSEWISRHGKHILWIPDDYRGYHRRAAVGGNLVVLGHGSRMTRLEFEFP